MDRAIETVFRAPHAAPNGLGRAPFLRDADSVVLADRAPARVDDRGGPNL